MLLIITFTTDQEKALIPLFSFEFNDPRYNVVLTNRCGEIPFRWQFAAASDMIWRINYRRCRLRRSEAAWRRRPGDGFPEQTGHCTSTPAPDLPDITSSIFIEHTHAKLWRTQYYYTNSVRSFVCHYVCLSVCYTPVLCQNMLLKIFFTDL